VKAVRITTSDICDAHPDEVAVCEIQFRSFGKASAFAGPCATVLVYEDHRKVRETIDLPGNGRVLIVDGGGSLRVALLGDRLAIRAMQNGWAGIIIHGAIRDSAAIDNLQFGVKALGTTARRSSIELGGIAELPVSFGATTFRHGDWVYADADAVIVSRRKLLDFP
jgi:regulator of ribonuclease activity A